MLTNKQFELLQFVDQQLNSKGVSPSFDEMKDALGLKSKSGIHRLIKGLEERGFIRRLAHRARALEVIKLPTTLNPPKEPKKKFKPNVIDGGLGLDSLTNKNNQLSQIPFYGKIAAGLPLEAVRNENSTINIPTGMLGTGKYYALEVEGDSMINAGIFDGDTAIIEQNETADNGTIVVALIDNQEVTLKRLRRRGDSIALEPENEQHKTQIYGPGRVQVQGHLKVIFRQY
ncbi:MAG: repressor LexA [Rhodospirillaceae bacterium]|nr:repressor LexA [Rhodospirillaceae bacterium]